MEIYKNLNLENLDREMWKDIGGYGGDYQVSNLGRIKSFKGKEERILTQIKNKGYLFVRLSENGRPENKYIHILLFETFNNYSLKSDECVHHINENKLSNILDNFQLMTKSDHNSSHMSGENNPNFGKKCPEISKRMSGEKNPMFGRTGENYPNSILTEQKIIQIRKLCDEGILTQKEIGKLFGVSNVTISNIKNKKYWRNK